MAIPVSITNYLNRAGVSYDVIEHPLAYTAQEEAAVSHVPGAEWAKAVVCIADEKPVLAVLPAHYHLDMREVRNTLGAKHVRLASEAEIEPLYQDCEVGAMPPLGPLYGQRVLVDRSARQAGRRHVRRAACHSLTRRHAERRFRLRLAGGFFLPVELGHAQRGFEMLWFDVSVEPGAVVDDQAIRDEPARDVGLGPDVDHLGCDELALAAARHGDVACEHVTGDVGGRQERHGQTVTDDLAFDTALDRQVRRRPDFTLDDDAGTADRHWPDSTALAARARSDLPGGCARVRGGR